MWHEFFYVFLCVLWCWFVVVALFFILFFCIWLFIAVLHCCQSSCASHVVSRYYLHSWLCLLCNICIMRMKGQVEHKGCRPCCCRLLKLKRHFKLYELWHAGEEWAAVKFNTNHHGDRSGCIGRLGRLWSRVRLPWLKWCQWNYIHCRCRPVRTCYWRRPVRFGKAHQTYQTLSERGIKLKYCLPQATIANNPNATIANYASYLLYLATDSWIKVSITQKEVQKNLQD